ncbi:MAG TPA: hypothetical protein VK760_07830 [Candidatus Acidoferrales bacterium]|jgi:hypothetical protein|nr:hypothetical protein [Candidatus Acidoferrales bacterium]
MRGLAAAALFGAGIALLAGVASAKTTAKIHVILTVTKAATVQTPANVRLDTAGHPIVSVDSFLSGWEAGEIPAVRLTLNSDPVEKGTDVATIDF